MTWLTGSAEEFSGQTWHSYGRAKPIIRQLKLQPEVNQQQALCQLHHCGRIIEIKLAIVLDAMVGANCQNRSWQK